MKSLLGLAFLVLLVTAAAADEGGRWEGTPAAAIYSPLPVEVTAEQLVELAPGAEVQPTERGFLVTWPDLQVNVILGYPGDFAEHLAGMRGFVEQMSELDPEGAQRMRERIPTFRNSIGTQISPGFDEAGRARALVLGLASRLGGTIFTAASFYDAQGKPILYAGGPAEL